MTWLHNIKKLKNFLKSNIFQIPVKNWGLPQDQMEKRFIKIELIIIQQAINIPLKTFIK